MIWAERTIWEIVEELSDEEFSRVFETGGSIEHRYLHMAQGHSHWFYRWSGGTPDEIDLAVLSRGELFDYLLSINKKLVALLENSEIDLAKKAISPKLNLNLEEMLFNLINHASYHRGQIVVLLRMLGKEVVPTDYVPYLMSNV